jgi:hypothetical protein
MLVIIIFVNTSFGATPGVVVLWGKEFIPYIEPETRYSAIACGLYHTLALKRNGTVLAWGDNLGGQCNVPDGLSNVVAIAAGFKHSLALKSDGTVVAWGTNLYGLNKVPSGLSNVVAISASEEYNLVLVAPSFLKSYKSWRVNQFTPQEQTDPLISGYNADPDGGRYLQSFRVCVPFDSESGRSGRSAFAKNFRTER